MESVQCIVKFHCIRNEISGECSEICGYLESID